MGDRIFEAEVLVQKPAEFEYRDGLVHVVSWLGDGIALRLAYPMHLFVENVGRAQAAIKKWQAEQVGAAILDFSFRREQIP